MIKQLLKKVGIIEDIPVNYYSKCIVCLTELTGRQRMFCSNKCAVEYNMNSDLYEDRIDNPGIIITRKEFFNRMRNKNDKNN
jgi:hypothetical protein